MWTLLIAAVLAKEPVSPELPAGCVATVAELGAPEDDRLRGEAVLVVRKAARRILLFDGGELRRIDGAPACWETALGYDYPAGHKVRMGDRRTPEGWYRTSDRPWSRFDGAITIHYPNADDARAALADGRITRAQHDAIVAADRKGTLPPMTTSLGGQILVHGGGASADWTLGCVALDDGPLAILRDALPAGMRTRILVLP
jgi:murein L,D-transpeptidase YafK